MMLPKWTLPLFVMLQLFQIFQKTFEKMWSARRNAHIRFLKLQVDLLKKRLPGNRVILDPSERQLLMRIGAKFDHRVEDTLSIVTVKTYRRWLREEKRGRIPRKVGRPRILKGRLRKLILRLARQNVSWGTRRIVGELKKLGVRISGTSIRRVLTEANILPDPDRRAPKGVMTPWRKFLKIHMNVILACDFFTKDILTPLGKRTAYVLAFIHLGSRKVFVSPSTYHPTEEWVQQQARNVSMWAEDEGIDIRFLIHDRDTKFTKKFDDYFRRSDGGPILTPPYAPVANSFIESWIGHMKKELLNHVFCFSRRHLDYINQNYASYHNEFRPHQSLDNRPPGSLDEPPPELGIETPKHVRRRTWLGGMLSHYYRQAA